MDKQGYLEEIFMEGEFPKKVNKQFINFFVKFPIT